MLLLGQGLAPYAPPPGVSSDEGFTSSPYLRDPLSPQEHSSMTFQPHTAAPPPALLQSPVSPTIII